MNPTTMRIPTLILLSSLVAFSAAAQSDYNISNARKVKTGHSVFPHDMRTAALQWSAISSACLENPAFGQWFDVSFKSDRFKFTIHTGEKLGSIKNPVLYVGKVVEGSGTRELVEIDCIAHSGASGQFSIEATGLQKTDKVFVLVVSATENESFAISITDDFEATVKTVVQPEPEKISRIFGRIVDGQGEAQKNVGVQLLSESKAMISKTKTDENGVFKFEKLTPDMAYLTLIEAEDTELRVDILLIDEQGKITSRATRIGNQLYGFGVDNRFSQYIRLLAAGDYALDVQQGSTGVAGRVVDKQSFLFGRPGITVGLYNNSRQLLASSTTDQNGHFSFRDIRETDYNVRIQLDKAKDYSEVVTVDDHNVALSVGNSDGMDEEGFFRFEALPKDVIALARMEVEDTRINLPADFSQMDRTTPIVLKSILFSPSSSDLLESSYAELDKLAAELKRMPGVRIEVSGHTDNIGSDELNMILSESRAKAVVDYLIKQGIEANRLVYKGYGETRPRSGNDTEKGRTENRRVEFVVIE